MEEQILLSRRFDKGSAEQEQVAKTGTRHSSLQTHEPERQRRAEKAENLEQAEQGGKHANLEPVDELL